MISIYSILASAVFFCGAAAPADDLDAALAAQKKKAVHRIYSERAQLDDQGLIVPQDQTDEELALDKKIRDMDAQADAAASRTPNLAPLRQATPVAAVRPAANDNWLTPAMLDPSASEEIPDDENNWLVNEVMRQKDQKDPDAIVLEQNQTDRLVNEKLQQQQTGLQPPDLLKQYQLPAQPLSSMQTASPLPAPLSAPLPESRFGRTQIDSAGKTAVTPLFSPQARRAATLSPDPLQQNKSSRSSTVSPFAFPSKLEESPPLSPIEMIKRSSPINRDNPFADDHMPQFKSSIWE